MIREDGQIKNKNSINPPWPPPSKKCPKFYRFNAFKSKLGHSICALFFFQLQTGTDLMPATSRSKNRRKKLKLRRKNRYRNRVKNRFRYENKPEVSAVEDYDYDNEDLNQVIIVVYFAQFFGVCTPKIFEFFFKRFNSFFV